MQTITNQVAYKTMQSWCRDERLEQHRFDIDEMNESHAEDMLRLSRQVQRVEAQYCSMKRISDALKEQLAAAEAKADEFEKQAKAAKDENDLFQLKFELDFL